MQKCVTHTQTTVQYQPVKKLNLDGKHPLGSDSSRELQTDRNQTVLPQYTVLTPRKEYKKKWGHQWVQIPNTESDVISCFATRYA